MLGQLLEHYGLVTGHKIIRGVKTERMVFESQLFNQYIATTFTPLIQVTYITSNKVPPGPHTYY